MKSHAARRVFPSLLALKIENRPSAERGTSYGPVNWWHSVLPSQGSILRHRVPGGPIHGFKKLSRAASKKMSPALQEFPFRGVKKWFLFTPPRGFSIKIGATVAWPKWRFFEKVCSLFPVMVPPYGARACVFPSGLNNRRASL